MYVFNDNDDDDVFVFFFLVLLLYFPETLTNGIFSFLSILVVRYKETK